MLSRYYDNLVLSEVTYLIVEPTVFNSFFILAIVLAYFFDSAFLSMSTKAN